MRKLFVLAALAAAVAVAILGLRGEGPVRETHARSCTTAPSGLVSWWPGDGNANDIVGGNDGTLVGGTTFATGFVGPAFSFDGAPDFVDAPLSQSLNVYTITAWAEPSVLIVGAAVVGDGSGGPPVLQNGDTFPPFLQIGGGAKPWQFNSAFGGALAQVGVFDFLVGVQTGTTQELYVNGVLVKSIAGTSTLTSVDIGRRSDGIEFKGLIDEVEIYNRALSASEIKAIFDAGSAGKCKTGKTVTLCHKPSTPAQKTLVLPFQALAGHLRHGDTAGPCP